VTVLRDLRSWSRRSARPEHRAGSSGRRGTPPTYKAVGVIRETRPRLLTPFFSTKEHGQGIGLTLVQEILSQHQIEYSLDSLPGEPTRFTMVF
jgi:hypothetical protein